MEIEVAFIILHFGDAELTIRAVDSILKLSNIEKSRIVIVDNGSNNRSDQVIQRKYIDSVIVDIIKCEENQGFSKGNNTGYMYVKNKYKAKFCVVMNNDVYFTDKLFIHKLFNLYREQQFYVCGPDIFVPQIQYHSSPIKRTQVTEKELNNEIERNMFVINECKKDNSIYVFRKYWKDYVLNDNPIHKMLISIKRCLMGDRQRDWKKDESGSIVLQGSCIIFSEKFINSSSHAFYPETFLYAEEYILTERCKRNNWKMIYCHDLQVFHTCQGSIKSEKPSFEEYKKKLNHSAECSIEALKQYKKYMKSKEQ